MTSEEFEALKELDIVEVKKVKTYHVSVIVTFICLLAAVVAAFIYCILPLHRPGTNILFMIGIVISILNIIAEITFPDKHLYWIVKIPQNDELWKILFLIAKCIHYNTTEDVMTIQFMDDMEADLYKLIQRMLKENDLP